MQKQETNSFFDQQIGIVDTLDNYANKDIQNTEVAIFEEVVGEQAQAEVADFKNDEGFLAAIDHVGEPEDGSLLSLPEFSQSIDFEDQQEFGQDLSRPAQDNILEQLFP